MQELLTGNGLKTLIKPIIISSLAKYFKDADEKEKEALLMKNQNMHRSQNLQSIRSSYQQPNPKMFVREDRSPSAPDQRRRDFSFQQIGRVQHKDLSFDSISNHQQESVFSKSQNLGRNQIQSGPINHQASQQITQQDQGAANPHFASRVDQDELLSVVTPEQGSDYYAANDSFGEQLAFSKNRKE